ncbi:hypothetical protein MMPV_009186 [Pyropia vietnamensis]
MAAFVAAPTGWRVAGSPSSPGFVASRPTAAVGAAAKAWVTGAGGRPSAAAAPPPAGAGRRCRLMGVRMDAAAAAAAAAATPSTNGAAPATTASSPADPGRKTVLVLGGDGFCGWPTALHLSEAGHDVIIVDNLSRRKIDLELECASLTPIASMNERLRVWGDVSGREIRFVRLDVARDYDLLAALLAAERPDAIVHFAEQRAAPYSMKGAREKRYTVDNNVSGTHNLLAAVVEMGLAAHTHIVHLGTMGVYGYGTSGGEIPEGYIDVLLPGGRPSKILHPAYPGSVYHATKCLDALLFQFYSRNDGLRVTDLHQGIVWGTNTAATGRDERLINRFDYDGDYGTVLNRFLVQAALDIPLTVYGTGGQTRAFIHISDTAKCVALAIGNPPEAGAPVEIFNQVAETHRVRDLAALVAAKTGTKVANIANPRNEAAENELEVANAKFRSLGYDPVTLEAGLLDEVVGIAGKYKERVDRGKILPVSFWNSNRRRECVAAGAGSGAAAGGAKVGAAGDTEGMLLALAKGDETILRKLRAVLQEQPLSS